MSNTAKVQIPVAFYTICISGKAANSNAKGLNAELTQEKNADNGAFTTLVNVIPKTYSAPIQSIASKVRGHFEKNGLRLGTSLYGIPLTILPKFKAELDTLLQQHDLLVAKLIDITESGDLRQMVLNAAGDAAKEIEGKIPDADDIREGYGIDIRVQVDFTDSKVDAALKILSDDMKNQLRAEVEASTKKDNEEQINTINSKIINAVKKVVKDILSNCTKIADATADRIVWKGVVDKIEEIVKVLPAYNVLGNPELDKLIAAVQTKFGSLNVDDLKKDAKVREGAKADAVELTQAFSNLF